jgi:hypothetical protein
MATATTTQNIGLQVPGQNQANWNVPIDYDLNLLDLIFGGSVQVPALNVVSLVIGNLAVLLAASLTQEAPSGLIPGNVFTLSKPGTLLLFIYNGAVQRPGIDYTQNGQIITTGFETQANDTVWAVYFAS